MPKASYKRRPDGRYVVKYKGQFFFSSVGGPLSEALNKRDEYKRLLDQGVKEKEVGISVQAYAMRWVSIHKANVSQRTYDTHVRILNRFIAKYGRYRMRDITMSDIQEFYNEIPGKSKSSINKTRYTINALFKAAMADRVTVYNPCAGAVSPQGTKGTHRVITAEERRLIHDTPHDRMRAGVMAMLYGGLRRGEAMALVIERDVDFESKLIYVREAVRFDTSGMPVLTYPKTAAGVRTLPLFPILEDELKGKKGLLIQNSNGSLMSESAFDRAWQSYISALETKLNGCHKRWYGKTKEHKALLLKNKNALPPWKAVTIRPHDLRHSFRTMLYDAGVDTKSAMKWLGHASEDVSVNVYTHLTPEHEKLSISAAEKYVSAVFGSQNGSQTRKDCAEFVEI